MQQQPSMIVLGLGLALAMATALSTQVASATEAHDLGPVLAAGPGDSGNAAGTDSGLGNGNAGDNNGAPNTGNAGQYNNVGPLYGGGNQNQQ